MYIARIPGLALALAPLDLVVPSASSHYYYNYTFYSQRSLINELRVKISK